MHRWAEIFAAPFGISAESWRQSARRTGEAQELPLSSQRVKKKKMFFGKLERHVKWCDAHLPTMLVQHISKLFEWEAENTSIKFTNDTKIGNIKNILEEQYWGLVGGPYKLE